MAVAHSCCYLVHAMVMKRAWLGQWWFIPIVIFDSDILLLWWLWYYDNGDTYPCVTLVVTLMTYTHILYVTFCCCDFGDMHARCDCSHFGDRRMHVCCNDSDFVYTHSVATVTIVTHVHVATLVTHRCQSQQWRWWQMSTVLLPLPGSHSEEHFLHRIASDYDNNVSSQGSGLRIEIVSSFTLSCWQILECAHI